MHKPKLIIVEDEFFAANHLSDVLIELGCEVKGIFHSVEEFFETKEYDFDGAFLDIFLEGDLTGIDLAKDFKTRNKPFVFLTANQDAITLKIAAHLKPVAYLSKPFKHTDIAAAVELLKLNLGTYIEIPDALGVKEVSSNDILFLEADGNYTSVITESRAYHIRKTMKELLGLLPNNFIQVHRSYAVNPIYIDQKSAKQIIVKNQVIPVSRSFKENL